MPPSRAELTERPKGLFEAVKLTLPHANGHFVTLHVCDSKDEDHFAEPRLATRRLHWPTGPVELCDPCADWLAKVASAMGSYVHEEALPPSSPNQEARRGVNLEGVPK